MTEQSALKEAIRARMERTGEKYTEARRKIIEIDAVEVTEHLETDLQPGTMTAVIGGGGMTNFGLVMPRLLEFLGRGYLVAVAAHEGRPLPFNMSSPFDFVVARGLADNEELARLFASEDDEDRERLRQLVDEAMEGMFFPGRPITEREWVSRLETAEDEPPAVLYVPDLQVDHPLSDWPSGESTTLGDFEAMPAQLTGLRSIARSTGAIVIGAHCMPPEGEGGWRVVSEIVDRTIVIQSNRAVDEGRSRTHTLHHYSNWAEHPGPERRTRTEIDTGFSDWRLIYMKHGD